MSENPWFRFRQNNSGGRFKAPAVEVFIQAVDFERALVVAKTHGLYFDGAGDCRCCGDRWSDYEERESPEEANARSAQANANWKERNPDWEQRFGKSYDVNDFARQSAASDGVPYRLIVKDNLVVSGEAAVEVQS